MSKVKIKDITLWFILPSIIIIFPFVLRFFLISGLWYFHINLSITSITILFILLHVYKNSNERFLYFIFLLQVPITYLAVLGFVENPIRKLIAEEGGLQSLIGVFQGFLGVYVFLLGTKLKIKQLDYNETTDVLRSMISIISFFSIIISLAIFASQAQYILFWALRAILLISGFIIGILALSMGFVFGRNKNFIVWYIGAIIVFSISFVLGTIVTPLTRIGEYIFPSMSAFVLNTTLFTGLIGYLLSDENCPLTQILQKIALKLIS